MKNNNINQKDNNERTTFNSDNNANHTHFKKHPESFVFLVFLITR